MARTLVMTLAAIASLGAVHAVELDFNDLPLGPIDGAGVYKYWTVTRSSLDGGSYTTAMAVAPTSPGSSNRMLTATAQSVVSRVAGPGFDFPAPTAPGGVLELEFSLRTRLKFGTTLAMIGFGTDLDGDGRLAGGEMRLGVSYHMGQFGVTHRNPDRHNNSVPLGSPATPFDVNEWIRVRVLFDFQAAEGDGLARMETRNLTRSETQFQAAGSTGVSLGQLQFPTLNERLWNGIFIGLDQNSDIDDVSVRVVGGATGADVVNLSNRVYLAPGRSAFGGFVATGGERRKLLIRAIGPGLRAFGIEDPVEFPVVKLYRNGVEIRTLIGVRTPNEAQIIRAAVAETGAFTSEIPANIQEVVDLEAGAYTFTVSSANGSPGDVLIEIYSLLK